MTTTTHLVVRAQAGDLEAYGRLVSETQRLVRGVALAVLRDPSLAEDAAQEAYLRAFRHLNELKDPSALPAWLRRIAITCALNLRRSRRCTFLRLDDVPDVPVLDDAETAWSELQRRRLASALVKLSNDERRLCDRRYHGGWGVARLAADAGVDETAMRKRLQRVRDKLRKEIEVAEQHELDPQDARPDFPAKIVELLARPRLSDLPENPVGQTTDALRSAYRDFAEIVLPEIVDLAEAKKSIASDAMYIEPQELHHVDDRRILRYDLTLPLLMTLRYEGQPLRLWATGKTYRRCQIDALHLDAFHQAEVFCFDERERLDVWQMTARVLASVDRVLPGRALKLVPTKYAMCSQAWELEIEEDGRWTELLAWGVYTDRIVKHLGGDPAVHRAIGVGYGLERLAMLRYGIDDIRKIEAARVA